MKFLSLSLVFTVQVLAQKSFLKTPVPLWNGFVSPVGQGNACALSPLSPQTLLCTSIDGSVTAFQPQSQDPSTPLWVYTPDGFGDSFKLSSTSGVTFSSTGTTFIYSTTDTGTDSMKCRVHHLYVKDRTVAWVSPFLQGSCSGTPVMSSDDKYVFLTHNMKANGNFTILETVNGTVVYQYQDAAQLLSPPGIFFNPTLGGNYADGTGNTNDLVVFGNRPSPNADGVAAGSASYAFQFPVAFTGAVSALEVTTLLSDTDFQATTPPLITSSGKSMFWAVSRSKVVGWTGIAFDRDAGGNSIGFDRGDPPSLPIIAKLAMGIDTETPTLYSGTASSSFAGISTSANTLAELWQFTTSAPVYTQAKVLSGDKVDLVVYFIDQFGKAYAVSAKNGTEIWSSDASSDPVLGDFAMNAAGDTIYFADTVGVLKAWQIAEFGAPTTFSPVVSTVVPTTIAPVPPPSKKPIASSNQPTKNTTNTSISPVSTKVPVSSSPVTSVPVSSAPVSEETAAPTMSSAKMLVGHLASFSISAAVFLFFV